MSDLPTDLITFSEACTLTGLAYSTFRWRAKQGAIRVYYPSARRAAMVSKADVLKMPGLRRYSPKGQVDDWIDRLVENAPALTDVQVNRLQAVLATTKAR